MERATITISVHDVDSLKLENLAVLFKSKIHESSDRELSFKWVTLPIAEGVQIDLYTKVGTRPAGLVEACPTC